MNKDITNPQVQSVLTDIGDALYIDSTIKNVIREALEAAWEQGYEAAQETVGDWYVPDRDH